VAGILACKVLACGPGRLGERRLGRRRLGALLLHAGNSYCHHAQLDASPRVPLMLGYFQRKGDIDRSMRIANQARLRALKLNHGDRVLIVNSQDPADYERCRCGGL
jgi:hypothetical protein